MLPFPVNGHNSTDGYAGYCLESRVAGFLVRLERSGRCYWREAGVGLENPQV